MNVSMIIVNYNTVDYLQACLASIQRFMPANTEVIVVDNASEDDSCAMVKRTFPTVKLIESDINLGFGLGNNLGVKAATNDYVMLFNSDAVLQMDTAQHLLNYLILNPDVICVMPRVVLPHTFEIQPKTFGYRPSFKTVFMQSTGLNRLFPRHHFFNGIDGDERSEKVMEVGWVSGVCMLMRRDQYQLVGGFDARFFMYCEDIDLCMKLSELGKIVLIDDYDIIHHGGASSKTMAATVQNSIWQQRHLLMIIHDYHGAIQYQLSRFMLMLGGIVRLCASMMAAPKSDGAKDTLRQTSLARLKDLISVGSNIGISNKGNHK